MVEKNGESTPRSMQNLEARIPVYLQWQLEALGNNRLPALDINNPIQPPS